MSKTIRQPEDYFNPETYMVLDRITGEELDVKIFIEEASQKGWQKTYIKSLCEYMGVADGAAPKVLTYILENKEQNNMILGNFVEIAKWTGVSRSMVQRVFKTLIDKKMVKFVRTGCHILKPKILCNGNKKVGSMVVRLWGDLK